MPTYIKVAKRFGELVAKYDYAAAHALLTVEAQAENTPEDFREAIEGKTSDAPVAIQQAEVIEDLIFEDWAEKQDGDVAIAYIALNGGIISEGITVTLVQHGSDYRIREVEWERRSSRAYSSAIRSIPILCVTGFITMAVGGFTDKKWVLKLGTCLFLSGFAVWGLANGGGFLWDFLRTVRRDGSRVLVEQPWSSALYIILMVFLLSTGGFFVWLVITASGEPE